MGLTSTYKQQFLWLKETKPGLVYIRVLHIICGRGQEKALMESPPSFCSWPAAHLNTSWRWKYKDKNQKPRSFCRSVLSKHRAICLLAPGESRLLSLSRWWLTHEEHNADSIQSIYPFPLHISDFTCFSSQLWCIYQFHKIIQAMVKNLVWI